METIKLELKQDIVIKLHGEVYAGSFITFDTFVFKTDNFISIQANTKVEIDDEEGHLQTVSFLGEKTYAIQVDWT